MIPSYALASALAYGVADFTGGVATRTRPAARVAVLSQATGLVLLVPAAALVGGRMSLDAATHGAAAGLAGAVGLTLYLRALALGPMGVVSPAAGVTGAAIPVTIGLATGTHLGPKAGLGMTVALAAIILASSPGRSEAPSGRTGPLLALAAGAGFGLFFALMHGAPANSGLWPIVAARAASLLLLSPAVVGGQSGRLPGPRWIVPASGLLDMAGNILYLAAARGGGLAVSAVLVSLYPVVVAILAAGVLRERLRPRQATGAAAALAAAVLLAL
jgi:drug/metabolite transporter (DMT)-like permease